MYFWVEIDKFKCKTINQSVDIDYELIRLLAHTNKLKPEKYIDSYVCTINYKGVELNFIHLPKFISDKFHLKNTSNSLINKIEIFNYISSLESPLKKNFVATSHLIKNQLINKHKIIWDKYYSSNTEGAETFIKETFSFMKKTRKESPETTSFNEFFKICIKDFQPIRGQMLEFS